MLRHLLFLTFAVLLPQCAPAGAVTSVPLKDKARIQKSAEPVVQTQAQLDAAFAVWTATAQNPINFRLEGDMKNRWRQLVSENTWGEYARRCTTAFMESGQVSLTLEYRDYVRLRAALRDPAFRATLSADEAHVLQELERRVLSVLREGMSDMQKAQALHDELVLCCRYATEGACDIADMLSTGTGSCEAYSATLCVMLEIAGIPARMVTGSAGGPHAWNLALIDGSWRHIDATWDDPVVGEGSHQILSHAYFCLTDAEIGRTHRWNRSAYPAAEGQRATFYRQSGTYYSDFASFWRAAMTAYHRGESGFEGYLATYGNPARFQRNVQMFSSAGAPTTMRWTGPDTSSGAVILQFGEK